MGAESAGIWFMVAAIAFIIMCFMLLVVGVLLIAIFNTLRRLRKDMKIYIKTSYHYAIINAILMKILSRFERNLAQWYNDATGRVWHIDKDDKRVYEGVRQQAKELQATLEEERRRLAEQGG